MNANFIEGCNQTMERYFSELRNCENPSMDTYAQATFDISHTLLHDVILMEARAYTLKFRAQNEKEDECIKSNHYYISSCPNYSEPRYAK